jgi:undecaprenyl pyrophosphate phosphatase UppP
MTWLPPAALLGDVQGLTSVLPSRAPPHLILAAAFFGWNSMKGAFGLAIGRGACMRGRSSRS